MKKAIPITVLLAIVAVPAWISYGRYAVEGGRVNWALINNRMDVLEAEIPRLDDAQKSEALAAAAGRRRLEAVRRLVAAGAKLPPPGPRHCLVSGAIRFGDLALAKLLLDIGADPTRETCGDPNDLIPDLLRHHADGAPEPELLALVRQLVDRGVPHDRRSAFGLAVEVAREKQLALVAAYLENPGAAPAADAPTVKVARLGGAKVERDELKRVCRGEGVPAAPAYTLRQGELSPVILFEQRHETLRAPDGPTSILPRWWTTHDALGHTQVVACARVAERRPARECRYEGTGGGVTIWDATYDLVVREARTARILGQRTVELKATSTSCPSVKLGRDAEGIYPSYADALTELVRPLVGAP